MAGRTRRFGQSLKQLMLDGCHRCFGRKQVSNKLTHPRIAGGQSRPTHRRWRHCQHLPVGGRQAIGKSLAEHDLVEESKKLWQKWRPKAVLVPLPTDVVVAKAFTDAEAVVKKILRRRCRRRYDFGHRPSNT